MSSSSIEGSSVNKLGCTSSTLAHQGHQRQAFAVPWIEIRRSRTRHRRNSSPFRVSVSHDKLTNSRAPQSRTIQGFIQRLQSTRSACYRASLPFTWKGRGYTCQQLRSCAFSKCAFVRENIPLHSRERTYECLISARLWSFFLIHF